MYRAIVDGQVSDRLLAKRGNIPKYKSIWIPGVKLWLGTHIWSTGNFIRFNVNTSTMCVITVDVALVRSPQALHSFPGDITFLPTIIHSIKPGRQYAGL